MNESTSQNTEFSGSAFADSPISRRDFVRLSAATAGALTLPGAATAEITSPKMTDEYEFVVNHLTDEQIPTLILFSDPAGFDALSARGIEARTTTRPAIAAYAQLTTEQVKAVIDISSATKLRFSPGSTPFWLLDYYPEGIFVPPSESVGFIDFEEMMNGVRRLENRYSDRLDFYSIGHSPGYFNFLKQEEDPKPIWVAEITNDINDEESFREKEKVFFSLSIHGDERQGAEAGTRFIEDLLKGDEPKIEAILDEIVLVFLYTNPDGWVARKPRYNSEENEFQRGTAQVDDPNRQYPTVGWIDPEHHPAEPTGTDLDDEYPEIDADVPPEYTENVPDSLAIVEHFRDYENLSYGSDLHGMGPSENMVEGLIVNDQFPYEELHNIYEVNERIDEQLTKAIGSEIDERQDLFQDINQRLREIYDIPGDEEISMPMEAFKYGTIYDTLQYSTTGILVSWMAQPEDQGGLGMPVMAHEMAYSLTEYRPKLVDLWVEGYTTVIRTMSEYAGTDHSATVKTNDRSTAVVTTDALTRSSKSLEFVEPDAETTETSLSLGAAETRDVYLDVSDDMSRLSTRIVPRMGDLVAAELRNPDGEVVSTFDPVVDGAKTGFRMRTPWLVHGPDLGRWTLRLTNRSPSEASDVDLIVGALQSTSEKRTNGGTVETPDPVEVLGYQQRPYKVSPFVFFEDYTATALDDPDAFARFSPRDVSQGALTSSHGQPAYDNVVIIHDEGTELGGYINALDAYVEAGGNLLLTDNGVSLLGPMSNTLAAPISSEEITTQGSVFPVLDERKPDHRLLDGTRPIQVTLWKLAPLGYAIDEDNGEAPITLIDQDAFTAAGGHVAGIASEQVAAGSLGTEAEEHGAIQVIGTLLPPAYQAHLHPFGMVNYTISYLGQTMVTNALEYEQTQPIDGEEEDKEEEDCPIQ